MTLLTVRKDRISDIANRFAPEIRNELMRLFDRMQAAVPIGPLTDALDTGNMNAILELAARAQLDPDDLKFLGSTLSDVAETAGVVAELRFDVVQESVIRWAEQHAANMITGITAETRVAINEIVTRALRTGIPPRTQARMIRNVIGLTKRDALAVSRFAAGMIESGFSRSLIDKRVAAKAARLLRRRAENIARTETMTASNMGQWLAWRDAADAGLIDPQRARRVWITSPDERLCPLCAPLEGETVGFTDPFTQTEKAAGFEVVARTGDNRIAITGTKPLGTHWSGVVPPRHSSCRCSVGLVFV